MLNWVGLLLASIEVTIVLVNKFFVTLPIVKHHVINLRQISDIFAKGVLAMSMTMLSNQMISWNLFKDSVIHSCFDL